MMGENLQFDYVGQFQVYIEELLRVQFEASDMFEHNPTKGSIREEFLKNEISKQYKMIDCRTGAIVNGNYQSSQIDIIVTKLNARDMPMGGQSLVDVSDAKLAIEVKSCAEKKHLDELQETAAKLKSQGGNSGLKVGLFCYSYDVQEKTMLKRFGYKFDKELDQYNYHKSLDKDYRDIDFVICISKDEDRPDSDFYIAKDKIEDSFMLFKKEPVSQYFFREFSNL